MYPVKRNGSEYYKYRKKKTNYFVKTRNGDERYAFDIKKGEIYPKKGLLYAKNRMGKLYYARDLKGNEKYGIRNKKSVLIDHEGEIQLAKYQSGKERYPYDHKGNEYYLTCDNEPYLLRDEEGIKYYAQDRKGNTLIPWNYYNYDKEWMETTDSNNNKVYCPINNCPINCICATPWVVENILRILLV
ncbi:hypothetical protein TNIN_179181 [Trichonephila inaurata madagascariensis]|uniref:Uncharacterized protein n=1 Tax=Trichonephila inaurata madagascariensis TaxID=2747483 RepID=A0A8X7CF59_9ARAC|nr:hypothetical protein TNIN_179181 [Trichonephila inaurata madagascariensis]